MVNIFLVSSQIMMLLLLSKGLWNDYAKYEKLEKYRSYCTQNREITRVHGASNLSPTLFFIGLCYMILLTSAGPCCSFVVFDSPL